MVLHTVMGRAHDGAHWRTVLRNWALFIRTSWMAICCKNAIEGLQSMNARYHFVIYLQLAAQVLLMVLVGPA